MSTYQYRVVPAPTKGLKAKGLKGPEARFANAIEELMNQMSSEGWEYQRAETLPSTERSGLTGSTTEWRNVLVFRKPAETGDQTPLLAAPVVTAEAAESVDKTDAFEASGMDTDGEDDQPAGGDGAMKMLADNGVEETSEVAGMTDSLKSLANRRSPTNSGD